MALLQDLIQQIDDTALRERIMQETDKLVKQKKFGLVFEEHLPEYTPLYGIPISVGKKVALKTGYMRDIYSVLKIDENEVLCESRNTHEQVVTFSKEEIVAVAEFGEAIYPTLKLLDTVENAPESDLWHTLIEADNYHALQLLEYLYAGKVDCIYIDPPYNTGAKDWKYNNDYVDSSDSYRHSKWLSFMEKRLKLAKKLLNPEDSVLIVTIDEKEYLHLGCLLEEIFPEARIQMISALTNSRGVARESGFARVDEYIFVVQIGQSSVCRLPLSDDWRVNVKEDKRVTRLRWSMLIRSGSNFLRADSVNQFYPIFVYNDGKRIHSVGESYYGDNRDEVIAPEGTFAVWPIRQDGAEGNWQISNENLRKLIKSGFVMLGRKAKGTVPIYYLKKGEIAKIKEGIYEVSGYREDGSIISDTEVRSLVTGTQWRIGSHDASTGGTIMLKNIFGTSPFTFPKSLYAVRDTLRFFVANKPDALIVDFFAGSGTTLHAVNLLNAEDKGHRRCIMITNNEVSADEAKELTKQGFVPGDAEWEGLGIAHHVTWPRTACYIQGRNLQGESLQGTYGVEVEDYIKNEEDTVISKKTGKPTKNVIYKKAKRQLYPELADMKMSDGFSANAAFYKLGFLDKTSVALGRQFKELLPVLWMKGGAIGACPNLEEDCLPSMMVLPKNKLAILIDEIYYSEFDAEIEKHPEIKTVFVVTDSEGAYREMTRAYEDKECYQLYRDYLDNFRINTGR